MVVWETCNLIMQVRHAELGECDECIVVAGDEEDCGARSFC